MYNYLKPLSLKISITIKNNSKANTNASATDLSK